MQVRMRRGLSDAKGQERLALIRIEELACLDAVLSRVDDRCGQDPIGLADCSDIHLFGLRLLWGRAKGHLYVRLSVFTEPGLQEHRYSLKVARSEIRYYASHMTKERLLKRRRN